MIPSTRTKKISHFLYISIIWSTISCAGLVVVLGIIFGLIGGLGNPIAILYGPLLVWQEASSVIELLVALLFSLTVIYILNRKKYYSMLIITAALLLLVNAVFVRASYYHLLNIGVPPWTDPATFYYLSNFVKYGIDKSYVYCDDKRLLGADPKTFSSVSHYNSMSRKVDRSIDVVTFDYARDATHVYNNCSPIPSADPDSFVVLDFEYAKDNNHKYHLGLLVE